MAHWGWDDFSFQIDKADGGALQEMKTYILTMGGIDIEAVLEEVTAAGSSWEMSEFVGLKRGSEFTITGIYDETVTTGPDVVFGVTNITGVSRSIVITWGTAKTTTFEGLLRVYRREPAKGAITKFTSTILPTGTITEA